MISKEVLHQFLQAAPKASSLSDREAQDFYTLGFSLYNAHSFEEAVDVFRVLSAQKPLEPKHWFALASSLQESRNYEPALDAWAMTAILDGENPYPHFHAAECAFSMHQLKDALAALNAAAARVGENLVLQDQIDLLKQQWSLINDSLCN